MDLQPLHLESEIIKLVPLKDTDFEQLYLVASDPLIWEQHPTKDRYKREIFETFFSGGIESKGAFLVIDKMTNEIMGSSRYYDYDEEKKMVAIGYTFLARKYWGKNYNKDLKALMINYAFTFVENIIFHVGNTNIRSQKAVGKIGGIKIGEEERNYTNEPTSNFNFVYQISKNV